MSETNQLQTIVDDSGLDTTKSQVILDRFTGAFKVAAEWEEKAKTINVTDASQTDDMEKARKGRLVLRRIRGDVESTRKELKEQSLREGKAIDGMANVLKGLLVPIEKYLHEQERFVEIKQAQAEKVAFDKAEAERLAQEEADRQAEAERLEKIRLDNVRLQKEADEKEAALRKEREEVEAKERQIRADAEAELQAERDRAAAEKKLADDKAAELQRQIDANKPDPEKMQKCPKCHHVFPMFEIVEEK